MVLRFLCDFQKRSFDNLISSEQHTTFSFPLHFLDKGNFIINKLCLTFISVFSFDDRVVVVVAASVPFESTCSSICASVCPRKTLRQVVRIALQFVVCLMQVSFVDGTISNSNMSMHPDVDS